MAEYKRFQVEELGNQIYEFPAEMSDSDIDRILRTTIEREKPELAKPKSPSMFGNPSAQLFPQQGEQLDSPQYPATPQEKKKRALRPEQLSVGNEVVNYFVGKGLEPHQAKGIASDLFRESSLNPNVSPGDSGTSFNLAQWHSPERIAGLRALAQERGETTPSLKTQLDYMWQELNTTHKNALDAVKGSKTEMESADAWMKYYEIPKEQVFGKQERLIGHQLSGDAGVGGKPYTLPSNSYSQANARRETARIRENLGIGRGDPREANQEGFGDQSYIRRSIPSPGEVSVGGNSYVRNRMPQDSDFNFGDQSYLRRAIPRDGETGVGGDSYFRGQMPSTKGGFGYGPAEFQALSSITPDRMPSNWSGDDELKYRDWFENFAKSAGIDPNRRELYEMTYDFRKAFEDGITPEIDRHYQNDPKIQDPIEGLGLPSAYKSDDHPFRFLQIGEDQYFDTKAHQLVEDPDQKALAEQMVYSRRQQLADDQEKALEESELRKAIKEEMDRRAYSGPVSGALRSAGSAILGGAVDVVDAYGDALRAPSELSRPTRQTFEAQQKSPGVSLRSENPVVNAAASFGGALNDTASYLRKKFPMLLPNPESGIVEQGVRSAVTSVGAGIPAAAAGAALGGPVGGAKGLVAGLALGASTAFGLQQITNTIEEADKEGIPRRISEPIALMSGGSEFITELVSDVLGGMSVLKTAKGFSRVSAGDTLAALFGGERTFEKVLKEYAKTSAKIAGAEVPSEMLNAAVQTPLANQMKPERDKQDVLSSVIEAGGVSFVSSLLFGMLGQAGIEASFRSRSGMKNDLQDVEADPAKRIMAAVDVAKRIDDVNEDTARWWLESALETIRLKQPIDLSETIESAVKRQKTEEFSGETAQKIMAEFFENERRAVSEQDSMWETDPNTAFRESEILRLKKMLEQDELYRSTNNEPVRPTRKVSDRVFTAESLQEEMEEQQKKQYELLDRLYKTTDDAEKESIQAELDRVIDDIIVLNGQKMTALGGAPKIRSYTGMAKAFDEEQRKVATNEAMSELDPSTVARDRVLREMRRMMGKPKPIKPPKTISEPIQEGKSQARPETKEADQPTDTEKLLRKKQMLEDMIETDKANGRPVNQQRLDALHEVKTQIEGKQPPYGETKRYASNKVFGHPEATNFVGYVNLIPIIVSDRDTIERRLEDAQEKLNEVTGKLANAEAIVKKRIKSTLKQMKDARNYLNSANATQDETIRDLLREETIPELNRLFKLFPEPQQPAGKTEYEEFLDRQAKEAVEDKGKSERKPQDRLQEKAKETSPALEQEPKKARKKATPEKSAGHLYSVTSDPKTGDRTVQFGSQKKKDIIAAIDAQIDDLAKERGVDLSNADEEVETTKPRTAGLGKKEFNVGPLIVRSGTEKKTWDIIYETFYGGKGAKAFQYVMTGLDMADAKRIASSLVRFNELFDPEKSFSDSATFRTVNKKDLPDEVTKKKPPTKITFKTESGKAKYTIKRTLHSLNRFRHMVDASSGVKYKMGDSESHSGGTSKAVLTSWVKDRVDSLKIPVVIHQSTEEFSPTANSNARGLYDRRTKTIHLFADNIDSAEEARFVIDHEAPGHAGAEGVLGAKADRFYGALFAAKKAEITKYMTEPFGNSTRGKLYGFDLSTEEGKRSAAAEWFADEIAAGRHKTEGLVRWWNRFVRMFRESMRNLGFRVELRESEIMDIASRSRSRVTRSDALNAQLVKQESDDNSRYSFASSPKSQKSILSNPRFKKWFGDSKVVNDKGEPLVVYHGTASDIYEFIPQKATDKQGMKLQLGWGKGKFYFTTEPMSASIAADWAAQSRDRPGKNPAVMPVYLKIENPIKSEDFKSIVQKHLDRGKSWRSALAYADKEVKSAGYDGIVDDVSGGIAVFYPTQIKSVFNAGTFDNDNPDIRYSFGGKKATGYEQAKAENKIFLGKFDGKERFTIDDSDAEFKSWGTIPNERMFAISASDEKRTKLGEILDHPELYKQYPDAKDIVFIKKDMMPEYLGWFDPEKNTIAVNSNLKEEEAILTLVHEIQHWIQNKEGFASGGNSNLINAFRNIEKIGSFIQRKKPELYEKFLNFKRDSADVAHLIEQRDNILKKIEEGKVQLRQKLERLKKEFVEKISDQKERIRGFNFSDPYNDDNFLLFTSGAPYFFKPKNGETYDNVSNENSELRRMFFEISRIVDYFKYPSIYGDNFFGGESSDLKNIDNEMKNVSERHGDVLFNAYSIIAGEVEARDVSETLEANKAEEKYKQKPNQSIIDSAKSLGESVKKVEDLYVVFKKEGYRQDYWDAVAIMVERYYSAIKELHKQYGFFLADDLLIYKKDEEDFVHNAKRLYESITDWKGLKLKKPENNRKDLDVTPEEAIVYFEKDSSGNLMASSRFPIPQRIKKSTLVDHLAAIAPTVQQWSKGELGTSVFWKALRSPEFWEETVGKSLVKSAVTTREEVRHKTFNDLQSVGPNGNVKLNEHLKKLMLKGKSKLAALKPIELYDRSKAAVSNEYKRVWEIVDHNDINELVWDDYEDSKGNPVEGQRTILKRKGESESVLKSVDYIREQMDNSLQLMMKSTREILDALPEGTPPPVLYTYQGPDGKDKDFTLLDAYNEMGQLKGSYMPRIWEQGKYELYSTKNGQQYRHTSMSAFQANKLARQLEGQGHSVTRFSGKPFRMINQTPDDVFNRANVMDISKILERAIKGVEAQHPEMAELFNHDLMVEVANLVRQMSFRGHRIARSRRAGSVTKGYIEDPLVRTTLYVSKIAGGIAKAQAALEMHDALMGKFETYQRDDDEWVLKDRQGNVIDRKPMDANDQTGRATQKSFKVGGLDMDKYADRFPIYRDYMAEQLRNPDTVDRWVGFLKGLLSFKLLTSPRTWALNVTSLGTTAVPSIMEYAVPEGQAKPNPATVFKRLTMASKDIGRFLSGKPLQDAEEQAFMEELKNSATLQQYSRDAVETLSSAYGKTWSKVLNAAMFGMQKSEEFIRGTTILAAYRTARKSGADHAQAMELAKLTSDKANGVYHKGTLPLWAQGTGGGARVGQMLYTYSKFTHNYLQMLQELSPVGRRKNMPAFVYATVAPMLMFGMKSSALWLMGSALLSAYAAMTGSEKDPEKIVFDFVRENLGKTAEEATRYGLTGVVGVDVTGSTEFGMSVPKNLLDLMGPFGGLVKSGADAAQYVSTGQYARAAEKLTPSWISSITRGIREVDGVVTKNGYKVWDENGQPYFPKGSETALRMAGFTSTRRAMLEDKTYEFKKMEGKYAKRKNLILEQIRSMVQSDQGITEEELTEIATLIQNFNESVMEDGLHGIIPYMTRRSVKRQLRNMARPDKRQIARSRKIAEEEEEGQE